MHVFSPNDRRRRGLQSQRRNVPTVDDVESGQFVVPCKRVDTMDETPALVDVFLAKVELDVRKHHSELGQIVAV